MVSMMTKANPQIPPPAMIQPMTQPMHHASTPEPGHEPDDWLSALLDGELPAEAARPLLRQLAGDQALQLRYQEYCAVRDALQGLYQDADTPNLTARVMARLESEPTVLAPMRRTASRRGMLLLAAATVAAITWGLWSSMPEETPTLPMAANEPLPLEDVQPYLAAHQDFTQAVISPAEMNFTPVSLEGGRP